MKGERDALEARGSEVIDKRKELAEAEEVGKQALQHYRDSLTKLEKEEQKFKTDKIEIDNVREKFSSALKENTRLIAHWRREIGKLELQDIPGDDKDELRVYQSEEDMQELAQ